MLFSIIGICIIVLWLCIATYYVVTNTPVNPTTYLLAVLGWSIAILPSIIKGFQ